MGSPVQPDGDSDVFYQALETKYPPVRGAEYERLVVAYGNSVEPVHRWFRMKEAYSPYLLAKVLKDLEIADDAPLSIVDPFAGSGTTATSALLLERPGSTCAVGIEVNPFLALLARVKGQCLSLSSEERDQLADEVQSGAQAVLAPRRGRSPLAPKLAAFGREEYFPVESRTALMKMRANLHEIAPGLARDLLAVLLAATVEPSSRLRKDGRALRFEADKFVESPRKSFLTRVEAASSDLREVKSSGTATVIHGSALRSESWDAIETDAWDLCLFSPPYPNNIDYTEVYKLEAWFLGLIDNAEEFRAQRRATMRSHPSIIFEPKESQAQESGQGLGNVGSLPEVVSDLASQLMRAVPADRYRRQRERTIRGYLADSHAVLASAYEKLRSGGALVYVVGNSRHGSREHAYTIASDVLLARLAEDVGFVFDSLQVGRDLHRRGRHDHLRESVVFLRKS